MARPTTGSVRAPRHDGVLEAELRKYNIRVMLVNPSEVLTNFAATHPAFTKKPLKVNCVARKIAHAVKAMLEMDDRGFTVEVAVFATNPAD